MRTPLVPSVWLLLLLTAPAPAQEFRATLTGAVSDAQNARIPGAAVAVTQSTTGAKFTTVSTASGQYAVPLLPPGIYTVVVEAAGFKRYVRDGVQLSTNERARSTSSSNWGL